MSWLAIGMTGFSLLASNDANDQKNSKIKQANRINDANAYADNLLRVANNEVRASRASLARFNQSVNNKRTLENTGGQLEAETVNYRRARDNATKEGFEQQLQFMEQSGAQAAASAFSGLTGGVVDVVNSTTALRKSRIEQRTQEAMKQSDFDAGKRQVQILQSGWDSLDYSEIDAGIDYGFSTANVQQQHQFGMLDIVSTPGFGNAVKAGGARWGSSTAPAADNEIYNI